MPYRHIVLFRIHDDVSDALLDEALTLLQGLREVPGVREWTVRLSDDPRKGRVVVQNSLFDEREAIEAFRVHPLHRRTTDLMRTIADWWIGDYEEPPAPGAPAELTTR